MIIISGGPFDDTMIESELIYRAQQGDGVAIEALYRRNAARVYSVVRRLAGDDAQAEDWAQEAWVRAIRSLPSFKGQSQFSTWLHRIAVNCALCGRRKHLRLRSRELEIEEIGQEPGREEKPLLRIRLEDAIRRLPDGMRRVLVLHDVEGYTHEEIGEMLGVSAGTCKSQLFKARGKMREMLREIREGEQVCST
ncbi:RNA polymerase sigma factor [soil metagenome]